MSTQITRRDLLRFSAVGLGGIAVAGLAACAPGTPGGAATTASAGPLTDFAFASWSMSQDVDKAALAPAINALAAKGGIEIATPSYPFNEYLNQLTLQVRGGQFTGAAQLDVAWLSSMVALGKLVDLGSYAKGRDFTDAGLRAGSFDGTQYGLPWTIAAIGLISNSELFDRAGVTSAPTTIDEFEDALRALKGLGDGIVPYAASTKTAQLKDFIVWAQTFGSPIIEDGKCTLGDDASIEAVTWYKKLFDDGLITADVDRAAARTLFSQGRAALFDDAPIGRSMIIKNTPDPALADKMVPIARPVLKKGDVPQELLWGHLIVVVDGEGSDSASEFAQWLTSDPEQTVSYFEALGQPPATAAALESKVFESNAFVKTFTDEITKDAAPSPLWPFAQYGQMETAIADQVQAVLVGGVSPADAMKAAGKQVSALL